MPSPVVIVTGAGSGIGRSVAIRFAREGWRVAMVGRDETKLRGTDALLRTVAGSPQPTKVMVVDLSDGGAARAVVGGAIAEFGRLDALVNNAGSGEVAPIERTTDELLARSFALNVFAPAHLIAAAWPAFSGQRRGVVVNISSMAAFDPFPGFFVYGATKAALDSFTRSAAIEGAAIGVKAFSVNPGAVETPLLRRVFGTDVIPSDRALHPDAIAEVVWECASGRRDADNGRSIPVVRG